MTNHPYTSSPTELPGLLSGDVTEVWVQVSEHHRAYNRNTLTITAVTPQQRDGVWGWAITTTKGNDDE